MHTDEKLMQNILLSHILDLILVKEKTNILPELNECENWDMKVEVFLKHIPAHVKHSKRYQKALANVAYGRIQAILTYNFANISKLKSSITLLRPKDLPQGVVIDENYKLDKFSEIPVNVHMLEGNHATIVDNKDCANIINREIRDLIKQAAANATGEIENTLES